MVNATTISLLIVECWSFQHSPLFLTFLLPLFTTYAWIFSFLLPYRCLQFFYCVFHTHFSSNTLASKKIWPPTVNKNDLRRLPCLFLSINFPPILLVFWVTHHLLINALSLKLWWPTTIIFCVTCTTTWKHVASSLWMNALDLIFWLFCIHSPPRSILLTLHRFPCTSYVNYVKTSANQLVPSIYQF